MLSNGRPIKKRLSARRNPLNRFIIPSMGLNRYGLSRSISQAVRREVRQRCGFGCVICGHVLVQYHHFDPPYEEATRHDPDRICLLCKMHHDETKGARPALDDQTIARYSRNPFCKGIGAPEHFSRGWRTANPGLYIGSNSLRLGLFSESVQMLAILPPEKEGAPVRVKAELYGPDKMPILTIEDNVWTFASDVFDIEETGNNFKIRRQPREVILEIEEFGVGQLRLRTLNCCTPAGIQVQVSNGVLLARSSMTFFSSGGTYDRMHIDKYGVRLG